MVRPPQMRPYMLLGLLFDSDQTLRPDDRCVRHDRSGGARQQVSQLVIQCLEQGLHCLSRREVLQCAALRGSALS